MDILPISIIGQVSKIEQTVDSLYKTGLSLSQKHDYDGAFDLLSKQKK